MAGRSPRVLCGWSGQLSHAGEATVNAGNATIGIRGGTDFYHQRGINLNGTLTPNNRPPVSVQVTKSRFVRPIQQASAAELSR